MTYIVVCVCVCVLLFIIITNKQPKHANKIQNEEKSQHVSREQPYFYFTLFFIVNFFDTWHNIYCSCGYFKYTDVPKSSVVGGKKTNGRSSNTITNKYKGNIQQ